jgi:hypothetical protein
MRWSAPPNWPAPPPGWQPPYGWQPNPYWPPAPMGWQFWTGHQPHRRRGFRGWAASMLPAAPSRPKSLQRPVSARRCWTEVLVVFVLFFGVGVLAAVLSEAGQHIQQTAQSISDDVLQGFSELAYAGVAIIAVGALSRLRGLRAADLGVAPWWGKRAAYRWQGLATGLIFAAAVVASSVLLQLVSPNAHYPFAPISNWHLLYEIPAAINAGIVEELVVVALLVTAAEQAGTRLWVIYAVGITLRLSYHVYYGPGVIVFVLWAAAAIWLFRRTRRITPLIVAHALYDTFGSVEHELGTHAGEAVAGVVTLALFGLLILVIVRVVQIASRRENPGPAAVSSPAWPPPLAATPVGL